MITIREGENITKVYRRHKLVLLFELIPLAFFAFIIIAAAYLFAYFLAEKFLVFLPLVFLVAIIFLHQLWIIAFMYLADFYLDVWILTNKRLVFVEQKNCKPKEKQSRVDKKPRGGNRQLGKIKNQGRRNWRVEKCDYERRREV